MREKTCWKCGKVFVTASSVCPDDGARLVDVAISEQHDPFIGHSIAERYAVIAKLGEGGMGNVYAARDKVNEADVAIKILKDDFLRDENIRRRFMHEARILSELNHPNAVTLDDFGQLPSGGFFMVMELLRGESLAERLAYSFLTYRDVFHYVPIICEVLDEAHSRDVVHRDLKPENIFICIDGEGEENPKLIDFGVAKDLGRKTLTRTGTLWGTPAYMSPEQARGDDVAAAADVYAIGIILYELICGHLPFNASTQMGYAVRHMHAPARAMLSVPGLHSVPEALDAYVLEMLSKDPSKRPNSMLEVAEVLRGFAAELDAAGLLDEIPAQEVDPVALKGWFAQGEDFPGASTEFKVARPASTPTPAPSTPAPLQSADVLPEAPAPGASSSNASLSSASRSSDPIALAPAAPDRRGLVAGALLVAIVLVVGIVVWSGPTDAPPIALGSSAAIADTTAGAPSDAAPEKVADSTPAPPAVDPARQAEEAAAADERERLRELELSTAGAAASHAATVIVRARQLAAPAPEAVAPSAKTTRPTKRRTTKRRTPRGKNSTGRGDSVEAAVKGTF